MELHFLKQAEGCQIANVPHSLWWPCVSLSASVCLSVKVCVSQTDRGPFVKEDGMVPPMPPDAYAKVEIVVKEEASSGSRPKRRKTK